LLARENRLTTAADFKVAMKTGRKQSSAHLVIYTKRVETSVPARFGVLVSKLVGNAVRRNMVKRRLRELARGQLAPLAGHLVVIRALPGAAELSFSELSGEFVSTLQKALKH
jgi:ribonuclease P protein component